MYVRLLMLSLMLVGCKGTFMAEVQSGYQMSPAAGEISHGGTLAAHLGGSGVEGAGLGLSGRLRVWDHGWAAPEIGPHGFVMYEDDGPIAFYTRANLYVGLMGAYGGIGPGFSAVLNPALVIYPGDSPEFLSIGLTGDITLSPVDQGYARGFIGLQVGFGVGGVGE